MKRMLGRVLWTLLLIALGGAAAASEWPTYMKDNSRIGYTSAPLSTPLERAWVYESPVIPQRAFSGPEDKMYEGKVLRARIRFDDVFHVAMADGRVFFGSSVDGRVHCMNAETGQEEWSFFTDGPVRLAPTVLEGRVYVGSDDGCAYCLDAKSGDLIWKLRAGPRDERLLARGRMTSRWPVRTSLLLDQGIAYFGAGVFPAETVYLYAVEAATGKVIWKNDWISQRDAGRDDLSPQGYMLATSELLYVPSGRSMPAAINRADGELRHKAKPGWRGAGGGPVGGSEAMLVDDQLYAIGEHHVLAMDQERGKTGFGWFLAQRMTMADDMAYMANGKEIIAVDHAKRAEASRERHPLDLQMNKLTSTLVRHPARVLLKEARELEDKVKEANRVLAGMRAAGTESSPEFSSAQKAAKAQEAAYGAAAAKYEPQRIDFNKLQEKQKALQGRIEELKQVAIKWRMATPHASALILAGDSLVVGGEGEVVVLDSKSGTPRWRGKIDGEARGLAVADGRLVVSTTDGGVYCFAPRAGGLELELEASANPYPEDALSKMYEAAAKSILAESGVTRGFCLVLGAEEGRLAYELARQSELVVFGIEPDADKVAVARKKLARAGLYGSRLTMDHLAPGVPIPYPNYFANLIVSDTLLRTGRMPGDAKVAVRHLKPIGGVVCLGLPGSANGALRDAAVPRIATWLAATGLPERGEANLVSRSGWSLLTRGALPGADDWSHQYGNAGNTASNNDERVRDGLGVLWYGDPGPEHMVNRHAGAVGPVSVNGRLFIQTDHSIMAYDAYNGLFLWEIENPGASRAGLKKSYEPGNMAAKDDSLFMIVGAECLHLDAASGEVMRRYEIPDADGADDRGERNRQWTYLSYSDGILFGTSTDRNRLDLLRLTKDPLASAATDKIFAYDTVSGERLWTYEGSSISHVSIAVGDGRIFFVDSTMSADQRAIFLRQNKSEYDSLTGKERERAEERLKNQDLRLAVALDARTGERAWAKPVDVTDCTGVGIGAGSLTLMYAKDHLILGGANANGHYWQQFLKGEFERRRVVVLSAATGDKMWARDANYRHRPVVVGDEVIAEPWSYDLYTGEQKMRTHPLTGEETPWKFIRSGHHCGAISATPNMMLFRSYFTAYYDLANDNGTQHFGGHRLGCWINSIPANGLVMVPEASAGCVCLFSIAATVVFEPRDDRESWGVFTAEGGTTPVRHMALNLGAPGDRRDTSGKLWLGYPRPSSRPGLDLPLALKQLFAKGGHFTRQNSQSLRESGPEGAVPPWIFASGGLGLIHCAVPLRDVGQEEASYTVRLMIATGEGGEGGVPEVRLQGVLVQPTETILHEGGRTLVFHQIAVSGQLTIDLTESGSTPVTLCGIEVLEAGAVEILR